MYTYTEKGTELPVWCSSLEVLHTTVFVECENKSCQANYTTKVDDLKWRVFLCFIKSAPQKKMSEVSLER
jgi:hypothetical protein